MIDFVQNVNWAIFLLFTLCYSYQFIYAIVALVKKPKKVEAKKLHKYGVLISARNESAVIGNLIDSIKAQNYPSHLVDIFVVADNCTDDTAAIARKHGAIVYERFNTEKVGKGYALDYLLKIINSIYSYKGYEGYFVFDADNVLDPNFISAMNAQFDQGYKVLTCYRNSKNYGTNWISAGYALWFLREARYLNNPRMMLGTSCAISGTGFLVSAEIINRQGGWKHHLLTEDIEFSIDNAIQGEKIGYCHDAMVYDEQPDTFRMSWRQRLRWAKGFYQVFGKYGKNLVSTAVKNRSFSAFDMLMNISPAMILSMLCILFNFGFLIAAAVTADSALLGATVSSIFMTIFNFCAILFLFGALTAITERKNIHCSTGKKILYCFTFPLFMLTYIPIAVVALFKKIEWKPIPHGVAKTLQEITQ